MKKAERLVRKAIPVALFLAVMVAASAASEIDKDKSRVTVRVYKTGLFSAFAHDHEISAPIVSGSLDELKRAVEFKVDARAMKVLDPGVSESDRSQVQQTMLGPKVLDSERFQEISFHSTSVDAAGQGKWTVQGQLTLHGQTHSVEVGVEGGNGQYRGFARLWQTDFGITPVSIGGGTIKVKDEVRIEFEIRGK